MKYFLPLFLLAFLFVAENSKAQSLLHPNNGKTLTPAILDGVDEEVLSQNIPKLNNKKISKVFRMPVFYPEDVDAKILTARPSGEYEYNMPNLLSKNEINEIGDAFKFYRDRN